MQSSIFYKMKLSLTAVFHNLILSQLLDKEVQDEPVLDEMDTSL